MEPKTECGLTGGVESIGTYETEEETASPDDHEEKPNEAEDSDEEEYHDQSSSNNSKESGRAKESGQNQWYQHKKEGKIQKLAKLIDNDYNRGYQTMASCDLLELGL